MYSGTCCTDRIDGLRFIEGDEEDNIDIRWIHNTLKKELFNSCNLQVETPSRKLL